MFEGVVYSKVYLPASCILHPSAGDIKADSHFYSLSPCFRTMILTQGGGAPYATSSFQGCHAVLTVLGVQIHRYLQEIHRINSGISNQSPVCQKHSDLFF